MTPLGHRLSKTQLATLSQPRMRIASRVTTQMTSSTTTPSGTTNGSVICLNGHATSRAFTIRNKNSMMKKTNSSFPPPTSIVPEGKDFSTGDFMVLKTDAEREGAPIWRYLCFDLGGAQLIPGKGQYCTNSCCCRLDSKTLLQRYNACQGPGGQWVHKTAKVFSNFSAARRRDYLSVAVKFIRFEKDDSTVQVIQKGSPSSEGSSNIDP